jgi:hypothetical protein
MGNRHQRRAAKALGVPVEQVIAEQVITEQVRIRVLPGGRMSALSAALYLDRAPQTLADWRARSTPEKPLGPEWEKVGGRIFYRQHKLDAYIAGGR